MASNQEQVKLKGIYLVPDARMMKPHFGPSEHIRVGLDQLRKHFDIELVVLGNYQESNSEGKTGLAAGRAVNNGFVGLLRDLKLLFKSNIGKADLVQELRNKKIDFIYERGQYLDFRGVNAARVVGIRHFYEVNWLNFLGIKQFYSSWFNRWAQRLEEQAYAETTLNFFVGTQHKLLNVPAAKVCTIQNGIDEALILANSALTAPEETKIRMCFVANLMPHHRFDILLQALGRIQSKSDIELHLIGYNFDEVLSSIPAFVKVTHHGPVKKKELADIMRLCSVGLISGGPSYSSFMKLFEYAAFKHCVVCPDLENVRLMFDDSEIAYFRTDDPASLAATLDRIISDPELRSRMGSNIYQKVSQHYTWEKIYDRIAGQIKQKVSS